MTVPNIISIFRIVLVGVFCVLFSMPGMRLPAFFVLLVSGFSDILDGYIARKYNQISNLGKVLDPIADKLFHFSTMICFWLANMIDLWVIVLFFLKELFMAVGGMVFYSKNRTVIAARWYGKAASCLFFATFVLAFLIPLAGVEPVTTKIIVTVLFVVSMAMSFFAGINYVITAIGINHKNHDQKTV